jgi:hypothetical protein
MRRSNSSGVSAGLDLGDAPRFEIVLLMKAHWLAVVGRIGSLDPKGLLVIRTADTHGAEMVDLAALAFADGECSAFRRPHVERVAIGREARMELFVRCVDSVLHRGRNAACVVEYVHVRFLPAFTPFGHLYRF